MNQTVCPLAQAQWIGAEQNTECPIIIRRFDINAVQKLPVLAILKRNSITNLYARTSLFLSSAIMKQDR